MWRNARDRVWHEVGQKSCPRCKHSIHEHTHDTSLDINRIEPGAALWPHEDVQVSEHGEIAAVVLLQRAELGGDFRIARWPGEEGVIWRLTEGAATVRSRMRDTVSCDLGARTCMR